MGVTASQPLWHRHLGHPNDRTLQHIITSNFLPVSSKSHVESTCVSCKCNKSHRLSFSVSSLTSQGPLDLIYSDIWGPAPYSFIDGFRYYVIFVDHYSKYILLYPIKLKFDVFSVFTKFKALVENYFKTKVVSFYSDEGGEFVKLKNFLATNGITHLSTPPHTPKHNGMAKRRNHHVVETGLTLLHHASMPFSYWSYAFQTVVYLINCMPTQTLTNVSLYTTLFGQNRRYHKLHVFGCQCFPWLRPYNSNKLEPLSRSYLFLGYSTSQSAYRCLNLSTNRLFISRHVKFNEFNFHFSSHDPNFPRVSSKSLATWSSLLPPVTSVPFIHATMPPYHDAIPSPTHAISHSTCSST